MKKIRIGINGGICGVVMGTYVDASTIQFLKHIKMDYKKIENKCKLTEKHDKKFFRGLK